ncbi:MAG TPA: TerC family protein [Dongiaceae bacterium]|jgi:YjbE family integral membrane protein|nr:TerC family protein [Dongiaceae bacterium]
MFDFHAMTQEMMALGEVIIINLVLSGDNAIVVGMVAASLPREMRAKVILFGIAAATVLRVVFALVATKILVIVGLTLAGGILLLWVCWKFWRELDAERRQRRALRHAAEGVAEAEEPGELLPGIVPKTMGQAIVEIIVADVSMSLDNVLAVAGAAAQHTWVLIIGLLLSVALMGVAAGIIAGILKRYHWIAYVGLAIILWVALDMIYRGSNEVLDNMTDCGARCVLDTLGQWM